MFKKKMLCALLFGISFAPSIMAMPRNIEAGGEQLDPTFTAARANHCGADASKDLPAASSTESTASATASSHGKSLARSAQ